MADPLISVVIAVLNGARTIGRAIESVLCQQYEGWELIVVDDGSTDETASVVAKYPRLSCIRQANAGVSVARNAGVEAARGDWVAFLDADDSYYPGRLEAHARWIAADPGIDFLTGDFEYRDERGELLRRSMESTEVGRRLLEKAGGGRTVIMEGEEIGLFVEQHFGDTHTLTMPRATFVELGGYRAGIAVCEDVNLLIRLCARSRRVGVVCEPLGVYNIHAASATRSDPLRAQQQTVNALLPLKDELASAPASIRRGLLGCIARARLDLASASLRQGKRLDAIRAVVPMLGERPGLASLRAVLSVAYG